MSVLRAGAESLIAIAVRTPAFTLTVFLPTALVLAAASTDDLAASADGFADSSMVTSVPAGRASAGKENVAVFPSDFAGGANAVSAAAILACSAASACAGVALGVDGLHLEVRGRRWFD